MRWVIWERMVEGGEERGREAKKKRVWFWGWVCWWLLGSGGREAQRVSKEVLICVARGPAVEGGRKSSQGLARERTEVVMPWVAMKASFWVMEVKALVRGRPGRGAVGSARARSRAGSSASRRIRRGSGEEGTIRRF